ncbi:MAG: element excision factor XisH family protein, partial [Bacteroidota bacterium]
MSTRDKYHEQCKAALIKAGWKITHDPFIMEVEGVTYQIDLGAESIVAAEKEDDKILVEIKSF